MMLTMHGPLLDVQVLTPLEWSDAPFPANASEDRWSKEVLTETNQGRLFRLACFGARGPWQRPRGMQTGEAVVQWALIDCWANVVASNAEWIPGLRRLNPPSSQGGSPGESGLLGAGVQTFGG